MNEAERGLLLELLILARQHPELLVIEDRHKAPPLPTLEAFARFDELYPAIMKKPSSPWDRGSGRGAPESFSAMMERLAKKTRILWTTPTIEERSSSA